MTPPPARPDLAAARRIVVKLGTRVLTHDDGALALARMFAVVEALAALRWAGREPILVSSGAVGLGRDALGATGALALVEHQACAAVGQSRLMELYAQGFARVGHTCAQVLLTQGSFDDRARYLSLRGALDALLRHGVIPVINMNDAVATTEELRAGGDDAPNVFGDNDRLAALVASKLGADLLVLLTDVDGVHEGDPRRSPEARRIPRVDDPAQLGDAAGGSASSAGKGGMRSKVDAAALASRAGCHVVIASGRDHGTVDAATAGGEVGTWFPARAGLDARRRWIAFHAPARGVLRLDAGAVAALRHRTASLLAAGVVTIEGDFDRGDVVELRDPDGALVGRGMAHCGAGEARRWSGEEPRAGHNVVRREHLVLEE